MNKKLALAIAGIVLTATFSLSANAQDLKTILLKPANGWVIEWTNPDTRNSGATEAIFVDSGKDIVAKLNVIATGTNTSGLMSCERNVTIAADTVRFSGCRTPNIVLSFDPNDATYPLKSKVRSETGYMYKAKVK